MQQHQQESNTLENVPWIEKYRPTHFDGIVLDPMNRELFNNMLSNRTFPHLLFYGPPGTGKTTTIINLINEYQTIAETKTFVMSNKRKENVMHLNASDERGIDIIRIQIHQFVRSKNLFESGFKFVILDEVDYMTKNAQQALKTLIQTCRNTVRFCLICNYISKIDESLKNEFICVRFNQLPKKEIRQFVANIAEKEGVELNNDDIDAIQEIHKSDIRSIINFMQLNHQHIHMQNMSVSHQTWANMREVLSRGDIDSLVEFVRDTCTRYNIDARSLLNKYFNYVVRNLEDELTPELLNMAESIVHASDETPIEALMHRLISA
jgi:DNA polymerase III delta prime subunit